MVRLVRPPDGTAWPLVRLSDHPRLAHFPIFKNGHSSVSDWLKGRDFGFETWIRPELPVGVVGFALIREPLGRYVSGLAQMWRMGLVADVSWEDFVRGVEAFNRRTGAPWTARGDRHFLSQSRVVGRMPWDRRLFRLEQLGGMVEWLAGWGLSSSVPLDRQKQTHPGMVGFALETLTPGIVLREYSEDLALWEGLA